MSQYTVICHRCGKSTFVDLSRTLSDQRCRACRGFLQGVDVSVGGGKHAETHRKLVVRMAGEGGREPEWHDQDAPVIPVRQRWPRFFRWTVVGGLACFLSAIGYAALQKFRSTLGGHRELTGQLTPDKLDVRLTPEWRVRATAAAKKAMAAEDVEQLLPLLYHPEVGDDVIRRYYASEEKLPLGKDLQESYLYPDGASAENAVAFLFTDAADRNRAFVVVEKPDGFTIDWPSLVGLGEMPVKQYIKTMPSDVVVLRARARIGHYYNHYFADSRKWLSIRLSDVIDENVFHGYVDRSLNLAEFIGSTFPDSEKSKDIADKPVIIVLKHPAGNLQSDQTQIIGLLDVTWYQSGGLKPLIEQARKEDNVRTGASAPDEEKQGSPKPPSHEKQPAENTPPGPTSPPPTPGSKP